MSDWLDLVGSFAIGGLIILMLINFNLSVNGAATQNSFSNVTQRQIVSSVDVIEYDFYKIGYRVNGDNITKADSNEILFKTDLDNNGVEDEIRYFLTSTSTMSSTFNPNDKILRREVNDENSLTPIVVTDLNFSYYDSLGQMIDYSYLTDQLYRDQIKTIKVSIGIESGELLDDKYETIHWEKIIRPKNI